MRLYLKILLSAIVAIVVAASGRSQAHIEFLDSIYDYGLFEQTTTPMPCRLRFTNTGDSALIITRVQPTCGCTTGEYPQHPLQPGDTASITLVYTPLGRPGRFQKDVFVYTNGDVRRSMISIAGRMRGNDIALARYYPEQVGMIRLSKSMLLAGELTKGAIRNVVTNVYNHSADSVRLTVVQAPRHVSVHMTDSVLAGADNRQIAFFYDTRLAPVLGLNEDMVFIKAEYQSSVAKPDTIAIRCTAVVNQDFSGLSPEQIASAPVALVSTTTVDLKQVAEPVENIPVRFEVKNAGTDPLEIKRVYSESGDMSDYTCGRRLLKAGETARIVVKLNPLPPEATLVNTKVTLITNDPLHPVQRVQVSGMIRKP